MFNELKDDQNDDFNKYREPNKQLDDNKKTGEDSRQSELG